jgi:CHAT domain-containing protein
VVVLLAALGPWGVCGASAGWDTALADERRRILELRARHLYDEGERVARAMVARVEADYGPGSRELSRALGVLLASLRYSRQGAIEERQRVAERAVTLTAAWVGEDSPELGGPLGQLATVLEDAGDYDGAIAVRERVRDLCERAWGPDDPSLAGSLLEIGRVHGVRGRDDLARPHLERARVLLGSGTQDNVEARLLETLGDLHDRAGEHEDALRLRGEALRIRQRLGEAFAIGRSLAGLSRSYAALGEHDEALRFGKRAYDTSLGLVGRDDACLVEFETPYAGALLRAGDARAALEHYVHGLALLQRDHAHFESRLAPALEGLSRAHRGLGHPGSAIDYGLAAERVARERYLVLARGLAETDALYHARTRLSGLDVPLSVVAERGGSDMAPDVPRVWDEVVRSRAVVLDIVAQRHRSVAEDGHPAAAALRRELETARARLARFAVNAAGGHAAGGQDEVRRARIDCDRAERALAAHSATFRQGEALDRSGLDEVRAALPAGAVLVAYVRYEHAAVDSRRPAVPSYLAFVTGGAAERPTSISLGPAARVDRLIDEWRRAATTDPRRTEDEALAEREYRRVAERLRAVVWDPLLPYLSGARLAFVVPDGPLHLVDLATLPVGERDYLILQRPTLHYLSAERDLVRLAAARPAPGRRLLALGAPDFDALPGAEAGEGTVAASPAQGGVYRSPTPCAGTELLRFTPLAGALAEVVQVTALWSGPRGGVGRDLAVRTGARADEGLFKREAAQYDVLHLATHGFMLDGCRHGGTDHPLLRSGLALAGANRAAAADGSTTEDGILTAAEVASLDLSGVRWVVLSACESGVGLVQSGEGMLGLRRAFEVAGAGTLVTSLWPVEDTATRMWMERLYDARLSGASTAEAVQSAGTAMIDLQRAAGRTTHPFAWGGFVAAGDWR